MKFTNQSDNRRAMRALVGVSSIAILVFGLAGPAVAQEASDDNFGEIIVTARKVEERLQDVPVAITAFSGGQLTAKGIVQISDVAAFTPGFTMRPAAANPSAATLAMRGQVQGDILATLEPSVGTYVDELYWGRAYGLNSAMLDVSNVQVLKGPQGTLFGRNTTGGALLITSNDPKLDAISGSASATYGRFNEATGELVLNVPIGDRIAVRGAVHYSRRDGWAYGVRQYNNATGLPDNGFLAAGLGTVKPDGTRFSNRDELVGRAKLLFKISDSTDLVLSGEWFNYKTNGPARQLRYKVNLNNTASTGDNVAASTAALAYMAYEAANPSATGGDGFSCDFAVPATPGAALVNCADTLRPFTSVRTEVNTETYSAKLKSDLGFGTFKLIGGYRATHNAANIDLDGSAALIHNTALFLDTKQWSVEAQLTGKALADKLDYAVGATYFTETGVDRSFSLTTRPGGSRRNNATRNYGDIDNKSYGIYGQGSFHITDALTFTGGVRYSSDKKGIEIRSANVGLDGNLLRLSFGLPLGTVPALDNPCNAAGSTAAPVVVGGVTVQQSFITGATAANDCSATRSDTFHSVSWTAGLDYKINPDVMVYAKASRGYRSGGQNLRAFNDFQFVPFKPEILTEYEVGFKADLLDRRVRLNVAAYRNNLKDAQRSILQTTSAVSNTLVGNAAKVRNTGIEADLQIRPVDGLTLGASGSINSSKYISYVDAVGDRSGDRFTLLPKYLFSLSGAYQTNLTDDVTLGLNVDYAWQSQTATDRCTVTGISACYTGAADATGKTTVQISQDIYNANTLPSSGTLNARVSLGFGENKYTLSAWGRNLTNNREFIQSTAVLVPYRNYVGGIRREPVTYGVTAAVKF